MKVALLLLAALSLLGSCEDEVEFRMVPKRDCTRETAPKSYEVYFVIDVSTSMAPFLTDVKEELVAFAENLPKVDDDGNQTTSTFHVIAFVNDVRWYPAEQALSSPTQVQRAFGEAIEQGRQNTNLNTPSFNAESTENLLDALSEVPANQPVAEAKLILIATDAPFAESPDRLSGDVIVQSSYQEVRAALGVIGARVHAFVRPNSDGLTRSYAGRPSLTDLPGSTFHDLEALTGARAAIRETLKIIAVDADCN